MLCIADLHRERYSVKAMFGMKCLGGLILRGHLLASLELVEVKLARGYVIVSGRETLREVCIQPERLNNGEIPWEWRTFGLDGALGGLLLLVGRCLLLVLRRCLFNRAAAAAEESI